MAIDFGTKRIGIAVTDPFKLIANVLETVDSKNIMTFLEDYFKKEDVECVVVGSPSSSPKLRRSRGGDMTALADDFCGKLKEKFPFMRIARINEFYTSKLAERTMIHSGINKAARKNKSLVDKISATIMLQNYLEKNS